MNEWNEKIDEKGGRGISKAVCIIYPEAHLQIYPVVRLRVPQCQILLNLLVFRLGNVTENLFKRGFLNHRFFFERQNGQQKTQNSTIQRR